MSIVPPNRPVIPVLQPFPWSDTPYTNVNPLTNRDNATLQWEMERVKKWISEDLIPSINQDYLVDEWVRNVNVIIDAVNASLSNHDEAISEVIVDTADELSTQLNEQNSAITSQIAAQDANIAGQLATQNASIAGQLATQNASIVSQLSEQNTATTAQLASNLAAVNSAVQSIIDATIDVTDPVLMDIIEDETSDFYNYLKDTYSTPPNVVDSVDLSPLDALMRKLDMRSLDSCVIALAGDSTGSPFSSGMYERAFSDLFYSVWPDRPARLKRWEKTPNAYTNVTWQDAATVSDPGGDTPNTTILSDFFAGSNQELVGIHGANVPVGTKWIGTTGAFIVDSGEVKYNTAYAGGGLPLAVLNATARVGKNFNMSAQWRVSSSETASRQRRFHVGRTDDNNQIRLEAVGSTTLTIQLRKIIGGTNTLIGSFASAIPVGASPTWYNVSISLVGTTLTATLNGVTVSGELSSSEVSALGNGFGFQDNSSFMGIRQLQVTGTVSRPPVVGGPSPLGWATVYNATVQGSTLQYQIDRLSLMYPEKPDVIFIHHGHNGVELTLNQWLTLYDTFLSALFAVHGTCPVVVSSQNPEFETSGTSASQVSAHRARMLGLRELARTRKWGYVPIYEAYVATSDGGASLVQSDGIHPVIGSGTNLQTSIFKNWVRKQSLRP